MKRHPNRFVQWWIRHRVSLFVGLSLLIISYAIYTNTGEDGMSVTSWDDWYYYMNQLSSLQKWREGATHSLTSRGIDSRSVGYMPLESQGESICRQYLESRFKRPFSKQRPLFLKNQVTGRLLELDCYNDELRLAVEYNGRQHYEYTPAIHKTKEQFYAQQYRDYMKQVLCQENDILLINVPYTVHINDIPDYIENQLKDSPFAR